MPVSVKSDNTGTIVAIIAAYLLLNKLSNQLGQWGANVASSLDRFGHAIDLTDPAKLDWLTNIGQSPPIAIPLLQGPAGGPYGPSPPLAVPDVAISLSQGLAGGPYLDSPPASQGVDVPIWQRAWDAIWPW